MIVAKVNLCDFNVFHLLMQELLEVVMYLF